MGTSSQEVTFSVSGGCCSLCGSSSSSSSSSFSCNPSCIYLTGSMGSIVAGYPLGVSATATITKNLTAYYYSTIRPQMIGFRCIDTTDGLQCFEAGLLNNVSKTCYAPSSSDCDGVSSITFTNPSTGGTLTVIEGGHSGVWGDNGLGYLPNAPVCDFFSQSNCLTNFGHLCYSVITYSYGFYSFTETTSWYDNVTNTLVYTSVFEVTTTGC